MLDIERPKHMRVVLRLRLPRFSSTICLIIRSVLFLNEEEWTVGLLFFVTALVSRVASLAFGGVMMVSAREEYLNGQ